MNLLCLLTNNVNHVLKAKLLFCIGFLLTVSVLYAQEQPVKDTVPTVDFVIDTLAQDSTTSISLGVPISKDSLEAQVVYNSEDSMKIDVRGEKIHLYGNAFVSYQTITLRADHIELDWSKSLVTAEGMVNDTTGQLGGLPEFSEGDNTFTANRMQYNFQTRKGIVFDAITEQEDIVVRGSKSKFISAPLGDTTTNDLVFSQDATFTTCTADHPHFVIRSKKQKVVPDKLVIVGPSNLEIMDVPTPLWLPFGFFPVSSGRQTGLIFPRDYEYSDLWGFGLKQVGWFFPLGEHFNLTLSGDIYLRGTWGVGAGVQYRKRYGYNGNFNLRFDSRKQETVVPILDDEGNAVIGANGSPAQRAINERVNGLYLSWSHNQDAAAHPMNRFGGSINFQTNDFQRRVNNDARSVGNNTLNSNFSFSRNWQDKPMSLSVAFRHSQNTRNRTMTVDFPTFQFQTQALYPFRRKERVGQKRWYEDITMRYTNEARATFTAPDTSFFQRQTLDDARYGVRQDVTAGTSFKLFKYFNLNPGASYREVWYLNSLDASFSPTDIVLDTTLLGGGQFVVDTLDYGTYNFDTLSGFSSYRTYSANVSLTTQVFGTFLFKKGPVRGLRHVIKPTVSVGFQPDYLGNENYYVPLVDTFDIEQTRFFSRFREGIYGAPPQSERRMSMNYSLTNIFEAKIFSRKDSTTRNIKLFDNIYVNGNYNFAADSLKWSVINTSGTTRLFKGATTFSFQARFDPMARVIDEQNRIVRVDRTTWRESGKPFEFLDATFRFNTNLTVGKIRALFQGKEEEVVESVPQEVDEQGRPIRPQPPEVEETDFLSLFENFSIRHNMAFSITPIDLDQDTFRTVTNSLELRGSLGLTPNWNVDIGSIGYDFASKRITYPFLGLRRDLHCWELGFNWAPLRNTYSFYLRVKPGTLDFIKVPYQRNNADGANAFNR